MKFRHIMSVVLLALVVAATGCSEAIEPNDSAVVGRTTRDRDLVGYAAEYGIEYEVLFKQAKDGDRRSLRRLFNFTLLVDGAVSESHTTVLWHLMNEWGDSRFAAVLGDAWHDTLVAVCYRLDAIAHSLEDYNPGGWAGFTVEYPEVTALINSATKAV